jgi:tetratricopeptide (TPR) repeat protein
VSRISEPEVLDLLTRLVEKSLVVYEEDEQGRGRYHLLETVRQYAREKLSDEPGSRCFRRQHRDHYLTLAEDANEGLRGTAQEAWQQRFDEEHSNLRSALDWCEQDSGSGPAGLRLTGALGRFWDTRGYFAEGRERYRVALAHPGAQARTKERAQALNGAGALAFRQSDHEAARALHEEALSIRQELGDQPGIAGSLGNLGIEALRRGDYRSARNLFEQVLALAGDMDAPFGTTLKANTLNWLGIASSDHGDHVAAQSYYEEALAVWRALGDQSSAAAALGNLGIVARAQGDLAVARAWYDEALAAHRSSGDKRNVAVTLVNLGELAIEQDDLEAVRGFVVEGLRLCREIGARLESAYAVAAMAQLAQACGEAERAARLEGSAAGLREIIGHSLPPSALAGHERHLSELRASLGEDAFERAFAAGRALSWEQAIAYALEEGGD